MKKQNNILAVIKNTIYLAFACIVLNACTEDEIYKTSNVTEGIPVEIKFGLSISGMDKVTTRSLTNEGESRINDLYVLVFDKNKNIKKKKFYPTSEIISNFENNSSGKLTLETTSGESYIYAVANVKTTELSGIYSALEKVKTINQLLEVTANLEGANVERVAAGLTMSGTFVQTGVTGEQEKNGYCLISDLGAVNGKIVLTRLESHITFKIATGSKVISFSPTSWQVRYVPLKSTLVAQDKNILSLDDSSEDYGDSKVSTGFGTDELNYRTFDFYMLESIKKAIPYTEEGGTTTSIAADVNSMPIDEQKAEYAKREAEIKSDIGNGHVKNSNIYKYSEKYATFVEIKALLEITNNESKDGRRIATVTFRIHLGGGITDPSNFKSKRNTKYTYLMKIEDVDDIKVEVEENNERRPGIEGDVVDSKEEVRTLDAHYNHFVMGFSYNDVNIDKDGTPITGLKFVVKTPFGQVTESDTPDDSYASSKQDYHWIHFKANTENNPNILELHNGKGMIDLFGLTDDINKRYKEDQSDDKSKSKLYYYTVFVDEYYYTKPPKGQNWGSNSATYWHHFANAENRYAMLVYAPRYSEDGNSSYASARYMITQRSIETYYSTEANTALGMEHINETGAATWEWLNYGYGYVAPDSKDGLYNTWKYLSSKGTSWDNYTNRNIPNKEMNTFDTNKYAKALARCLSRNRDENGDGTITPDEIKWYVPTSEQLMGMYLGAKSLPSPLFDAANVDFDKEDPTTWGQYHYVTSDGKRIWSEEGASVGDVKADVGPNGTHIGDATNFRCVRNLGTDINKGTDNISLNKKRIQEAYEYTENKMVGIYNPTTDNYETTSANRIFNLKYLTEQNIRGIVKNGEVEVHDNFQDGNKPYKAFQMAESKLNDDEKDFDFNKQKEIWNGHQGWYDEWVWDDGYKITPKNEKGEDVILSTWNVIVRSYWYTLSDRMYKLKTDGDRSKCKNYSEKPDGSDKGTWRAPNQREMMLMYMQDINNVSYTYSRTTSKYNEKRQCCTDTNLRLSAIDQRDTWSIRCVRDVIIK